MENAKASLQVYFSSPLGYFPLSLKYFLAMFSSTLFLLVWPASSSLGVESGRLGEGGTDELE